MAEIVEHLSGRPPSDFDNGARHTQPEPSRRETGTYELPGPPPPIAATDDGQPGQRFANSPPAPPAPQQSAPQQPAPPALHHPAPPAPPPAPPEHWRADNDNGAGHPAGHPHQGWDPQHPPLPPHMPQPMHRDRGRVQVPGNHAAPPAAPRREHDPNRQGAHESGYQAPAHTGPGPQSVPERQQAVGRNAGADQYRRPSAPIQAAAAGIHQQLIATAAQESAPVAKAGWRGLVNKAGINIAPSKKEKRRLEVYQRIRAPKDEMYSISVLTLKGGAGKTTVTATLGQVISSIRADGVIAVDSDPDAGDLPLRTAEHPENLSMMEMLDTDSDDLRQRDQVQRFLSTTPTDLNVLASGWRPDGDRVMVPEDIRDVYEVALHYYSVLLWDGDEALNSALVREVLAKSNALVLLVEASRPGAIKAGLAIDWLRNHGYEGLLARTVLVVNETTSQTRLDMTALMSVLARQQLKLHRIPFDKHLDAGVSINLDKLAKKTRRAFEDLAAMLADDFCVPQPAAPAPTAS